MDTKETEPTWKRLENTVALWILWESQFAKLWRLTAFKVEKENSTCIEFNLIIIRHFANRTLQINEVDHALSSTDDVTAEIKYSHV